MNILILLCNRLSKLLGHVTKGLSYIFHYFWPNKRFTLPRQQDPIWPSRNNKKIPRIIWQTNFTDKATLPVYLNFLFNRLMSLSYEYRFLTTQDRADFIAENFPGKINDYYQQLTVGASQADLWRLLTLKKHGGIYMDIDAHFVWPAALLIKDDYRDLYVRIKGDRFTNYFIASSPQNPIIDDVIQVVLDNIDKKEHTSVYDLTGPDAFDRVLRPLNPNSRFYRYTCVQGSFTNEHFQYIDKAEGKWTHVKVEDLLKKDDDKA